MSSRNQARGRELEKEVEAAGIEAGLRSTRVFGSGAYKQQLGDDFAGDVRLGKFRVECKRRKSGFKLLYDAFLQDDADMVCVRQDRGERLYVLKEPLLMALLRCANTELGRLYMEQGVKTGGNS